MLKQCVPPSSVLMILLLPAVVQRRSSNVGAPRSCGWAWRSSELTLTSRDCSPSQTQRDSSATPPVGSSSAPLADREDWKPCVRFYLSSTCPWPTGTGKGVALGLSQEGTFIETFPQSCHQQELIDESSSTHGPATPPTQNQGYNHDNSKNKTVTIPTGSPPAGPCPSSSKTLQPCEGNL